ncbi:hypothetical protein V6N13_048056 [Hibiscus sabdariffa]|uniref:Uncharacterized protein n=1 Tax=Hibiscus sabdariffa TaxID=183260 RepID=A0ABR2F651_9ROSI
MSYSGGATTHVQGDQARKLNLHPKPKINFLPWDGICGMLPRTEDLNCGINHHKEKFTIHSKRLAEVMSTKYLGPEEKNERWRSKLGA